MARKRKRLEYFYLKPDHECRIMEQSGDFPLKFLSFANPVIYSYTLKVQLKNSTSGQKSSCIFANPKFRENLRSEFEINVAYYPIGEMV